MNRLLFLFLFLFNFQVKAQIFLGNEGNISFFSETPLENISAVNKNVSAVFDASTNDLVFQLKITDFIFPNALMQEHFNENYLESDIYPNSTFLGKVNLDNKDKAIVEGDLTMHGISNNIIASGDFFQDENTVTILAEFSVKLDEFSIKIPTIVMYKIAEKINIKVNIKLKKVE